jgi:hypothetical protein
MCHGMCHAKYKTVNCVLHEETYIYSPTLSFYFQNTMSWHTHKRNLIYAHENMKATAELRVAK